MQMKPSIIFRPLRLLLALAAISFTFAQCGGDTASQESESTEEETVAEAPVHKATDPIERGEELFIAYCQICHGKGDMEGAMADELPVKPPKLTQIAARRDGNFPEGVIFDIIKGKEQLPGHAAENMPIWGETFLESENLANQEEVDVEIKKIVAYLQTIQAPSE